MIMNQKNLSCDLFDKQNSEKMNLGVANAAFYKWFILDYVNLELLK